MTRRIGLEGRTVNFRLSRDENHTEVHFNFHFDVAGAAEGIAMLDAQPDDCHDLVYQVLEQWYDLAPEEEGGCPVRS